MAVLAADRAIEALRRGDLDDAMDYVVVAAQWTKDVRGDVSGYARVASWIAAYAHPGQLWGP